MTSPASDNGIVISPPGLTPKRTIRDVLHALRLLPRRLRGNGRVTKRSLMIVANGLSGLILLAAVVAVSVRLLAPIMPCACSASQRNAHHPTPAAQRDSATACGGASPRATCQRPLRQSTTNGTNGTNSNNGAPPTTNPVDSRVVAVLQNIQHNGFNYATASSPGLFIDWRYGTVPLQANGGSCTVSNATDSCPSPGHDPLTDIRYLHNLYEYQRLHPSDAQFAGEIQRYTALVLHEFPTGTNSWGWVYLIWRDIADDTNDATLKATMQQYMQNMGQDLDTHFYHSAIGAFYDQSNGSAGTAHYNANVAINQGAALILAGKQFHNDQWMHDGETGISFVIQHAYLPGDHAFLGDMTNLFNSDGTANSNETIFRSSQTNGGNVKPSENGESAFMLLEASRVDSAPMLLSTAEDILNGFSDSVNTLGIWDSHNEGYFYGVSFPGSTYQNPGTPVLNTAKRESGRQLSIWKAYHLAHTLTGNAIYTHMDQQMLDVALNKAFYAPGEGYLYAMSADWQPTATGKDFVTSEAMGIAVEALLLEEQ